MDQRRARSADRNRTRRAATTFADAECAEVLTHFPRSMAMWLTSTPLSLTRFFAFAPSPAGSSSSPSDMTPRLGESNSMSSSSSLYRARRSETARALRLPGGVEGAMSEGGGPAKEGGRERREQSWSSCVSAQGAARKCGRGGGG